MTGHTLVCNQFNQFLNDSYSELIRKAYAICDYSNYTIDLLDDAVQRTIERIRKSGFTNTEKFAGYILQSVKHEYHREERKASKRYFVDIDDHHWEVEQKLMEDDHNSQHHYFEIELVTKYLFQYIERFYPPKHVTLYKIYYTTENDTYRKVVQSQIGVSMNSVRNILSMMKTDVKRNLIKYITHEESKREIWRGIKNYPNYLVSNRLNVKDVFNNNILPDKRGNYLLKNNRGEWKEKSIEQLTGKFKPDELKEKGEYERIR